MSLFRLSGYTPASARRWRAGNVPDLSLLSWIVTNRQVRHSQDIGKRKGQEQGAERSRRRWRYRSLVKQSTNHGRVDMPHKLEVHVAENGDVQVIMDPVTAARLTGRSLYGRVPEAQEELEQAIAIAWYRAGCPIVEASKSFGWSEETWRDTVRPH